MHDTQAPSNTMTAPLQFELLAWPGLKLDTSQIYTQRRHRVASHQPCETRCPGLHVPNAIETQAPRQGPGSRSQCTSCAAGRSRLCSLDGGAAERRATAKVQLMRCVPRDRSEQRMVSRLPAEPSSADRVHLCNNLHTLLIKTSGAGQISCAVRRSSNGTKVPAQPGPSFTRQRGLLVVRRPPGEQ
jgi:hypothetical protein